jgi:hypothetical protein
MLRTLNRARWVVASAIVVVAPLVTGCDVKQELLAPQNPGIIDPASVNSAPAAAALRVPPFCIRPVVRLLLGAAVLVTSAAPRGTVQAPTAHTGSVLLLESPQWNGTPTARWFQSSCHIRRSGVARCCCGRGSGELAAFRRNPPGCPCVSLTKWDFYYRGV